MNKINVSFGVVVYNDQSNISDFVKNINSLNCDNFNFNIYVIDNCSTDNTARIVHHLTTKYTNLKLINAEKNRGFGAGNNLVLNRITSKYHIVLNSDIRIQSKEELETMINFMEGHPEVGLLSPKLVGMDGKLQKLYKHNPSVLDMALRFISPKVLKKRQAWFVHEETGYNNIGKIENASGAFMLFRTKIFKEINGFDERYFMYMEDSDITRTVNSKSTAIFFPKATITHVWSRANRRNPKYVLIMLKSMYKYFNKWGWKLW